MSEIYVAAGTFPDWYVSYFMHRYGYLISIQVILLFAWCWPIVIINYGLLSSLSRVLKYSQSSKAGSAAPHCVVPITIELRPKATTHRANTYTGFMLPVSEV